MNKKLCAAIEVIKIVAEASTGPRGGKIIGTTSSGKPIYDKAGHKEHKGFTGKDHQEAYAAHNMLGHRARDAKDEDKARHHFEQSGAHRSKMEAHETLGEKLRSYDDAQSKVKVAVDFDTYKKEHPGTEKTKADAMFKQREQIKKDIHDSNESKKGLKPGDIFHHKDRHGEGHGVVLSNDDHGGFMFHESDEKGNVKKGEHRTGRDVTKHSNMLFGNAKKVGEKKLESDTVNHKGKDYTYHKSGDPEVDQTMAHHDARAQLFKDHATARQKGVHSRNESVNSHDSNAKMQAKFFDHVKGGGKPEDFRMTPKKSSVLDSMSLICAVVKIAASIKKANHALKFFSDAGHGWLEVPMALYKESGITASTYSYHSTKKNMVYLEEDSDAPKFEKACKEKGIAFHVTDVSLPGMSPIRNMARMPGH